MRILTKKRITEYSDSHSNSKASFDSWLYHFSKASYKNFNEIKCQFGSADSIIDNTVIFNICGNEHRLYVDINYSKQIIYIIWIGTHSDYDKLCKGNKLIKMWTDRKKRIEK